MPILEQKRENGGTEDRQLFRSFAVVQKWAITGEGTRWSSLQDWEMLKHVKGNEEILLEGTKIFSICYSSGTSFKYKVLDHTKIICFQNIIL